MPLVPLRHRPTTSPLPWPTAAVRVHDLVKVHGRGPAAVRALDGVSLTVDRGTFCAIVGASGSGKSTLLHCAAGLDTPTSGEVEIGGTRLDGLSDQALTAVRRDQVGFVFQAFNLLPVLTARENILLPGRLARRRPDHDRLEQVTAALGLTDRLHHYPAHLSGGQQQRVAVARALLDRPDVVFADEPTGNLDTAAAEVVLSLLRGAVDGEGQSVVMVTHDPVAAARADRVLVVRDGRLCDELTNPTPAAVAAATRGRWAR